MSTERKTRFEQFLDWFDEHITGDEKGQGQIFFDRLMQAFGNAGVLEAGASLEYRTRKRKGTIGFPDFVWKPRVNIELKKRGEKLERHYEQAFEDWLTLVPNRPEYMVLCNFDEFWIYDLNQQMNDPVHKMNIKDLPSSWGALAFLFPKAESPLFDNHNIAVTEEAAKIVGSLYLSLVSRGVSSSKAQRFVLQIVVALFSEDVGLLPKYILQKILTDAVKNPVIQKELNDLFIAMSTRERGKKPKKYAEIHFFNGGLFDLVDSVELTFKELDLLCEASKQNWEKVRPSIFGSIFEGSMDPKKRHGHGIHYTSELDIQKIIGPTIVKPFRKRIDSATNKKQLSSILEEIRNFRVLDPACGSGNFLYLAFRELRRLEMEVVRKVEKNFNPNQARINLIQTKNFYGIDTNGFGLELAKIALSLGRKLSADEFNIVDQVLPFENLETNFSDKDAILNDWPEADVIIGNPPYLAKNKMLNEFGQQYLDAIREKMPEVSGYADYCVYWFRKAHDSLKVGGRAGLVGTNTIRQNESRGSGLGYILRNNGTITEAVSSQVWSGDAVVHVSIVNWIKGTDEGRKKLFRQLGDNQNSPWEVSELDEINSSLSKNTDVSDAKVIGPYQRLDLCFPGQQHGHEGFLLKKEDFVEIKKKETRFKEVIFPFYIGDELIGRLDSLPQRYVIDFGEMDLTAASSYKVPFSRVQDTVYVWRKAKAEEEKNKNEDIKKSNPKARVDRQYASSYSHWWQLRRKNTRMVEAINRLQRYIVCSRHTKRPIFEFVSPLIRPNDSIQVFAFEDDYSYGILQSSCHWYWFMERGSTIKGDYRYTSKTVFNTFPWPQNVSEVQVKKIAKIASNLRKIRNNLKNNYKVTLRDMYKSIELDGKSELRDAHEELDRAVLSAYGIDNESQILESLLALNLMLASGDPDLVLPGIPPCVKDSESLRSSDCIKPPLEYS